MVGSRVLWSSFSQCSLTCVVLTTRPYRIFSEVFSASSLVMVFLWQTASISAAYLPWRSFCWPSGQLPGPITGPFPGPGPPPRALSPLAHPPTPPFSNLNFTPLSCLKIRRRGRGEEGDHLCRCLGLFRAPFRALFPQTHFPTPPFSNLNFTLLSCLQIR